jgi:hypothetical protein
MRLKRLLRAGMFGLVLEVSVCSGVTMRPEDIAMLVHAGHRVTVAESIHEREDEVLPTSLLRADEDARRVTKMRSGKRQ